MERATVSGARSLIFLPGAVAVVIADVHSRRLEKAVEELADNSEKTVKGYELDVADRGAINEVLADIASTVGPVRVLVNSVGRTTIGDILDYPAEEFERLLSVNLTSPWYLTMGAVRHMREAGGGAIVNISSIAPPVGFAMIEPPYAAAKAGLHAITRGFANAAGVSGFDATRWPWVWLPRPILRVRIRN